MAWSFGDGFDLYAAIADMDDGYWDSAVAGVSSAFVAGRFAGSQALSIASSASNPAYTKTSAVNDAVHHVAFAFRQSAAISGSNLGAYIELFDGATGQCSVVFRSDGAILLTSGSPVGTVLATYAGAFTVAGTWYQFEVEIVINNTTGSFKVRKNGNAVDDFSLGSLNTRTTANNYANKLQIGMNATVNAQIFDDFFWQSGSATGGWLGDLRCYTRMPASDSAVSFARTPTTYVQTPFTANTTLTTSTTLSYYTPFAAAYEGTVNTLVASINTGFTGSLKCSVFADAAGAPSTILSSATTLVNPVTGNNTITFPTPFTILKNVTYWVGFATSIAATTGFSGKSTSGSNSSTTGYSAFPAASPVIASSNGTAPIFSLTISVANNATVVNEPQQDALTSYVYSSTPGDADFYGIGSIASTPSTVIATTVRAYAQKSDAGTRTAAVQLKSGATTVASPTVVLTTSGWQWAWRTDLVDPATGAAWTPAAVNNTQIGPKTVA